MNKKVVKLLNYLLIGFFSLIFIIFLNSSNKSIDNISDNNLLEEKEDFKIESIVDDIDQDNKDLKNSEDIKNEKENIKNIELYKIITVVDGDTVKIYINNKLESIRMIGLDTPETVDPRKEVQCFGLEASKKAKEILEGKSVILEKDESQGERDKYGRLLLYLYLEDGTFFNKWMIENGYGHEYTYNIPYKYQTEFKNAEKYARENKLGLWADDACVESASSDSINNDSQSNTNSREPTISESVQIIDGPQVKKSSTGICHEKGTTYYERTKTFIPYSSIEDCLSSGGRMPKS